MAQYTIRQSVYDAALGEYLDMGFSLQQIGDNVLELRFKNVFVAFFSQTEATHDNIRTACRKHMESFNV